MARKLVCRTKFYIILFAWDKKTDALRVGNVHFNFSVRGVKAERFIFIAVADHWRKIYVVIVVARIGDGTDLKFGQN
jgi:hypothetical protein